MALQCTRCEGTGILNIHQIPEDVAERDAHDIKEWLEETDEVTDATVCDCCGNGEEWYGTPGEHYGPDDRQGESGPYAYNGGLCECH